MPTDKQIARWTVKGWNDDHIEYEDDEGRYVLYSDHVAALTAAEQAEPAPAARSGAVKVDAKAIVEDAIKRCRELHDYSGRPAWEKAVEDAILSALTTAEQAEEFEERILTDEECAMVDAAWERHKAAKPQFLPTEDGEFNGNAYVSETDEEEIAKLIWERFAPAHEVDWPCGNAGEYRQLAKDIIGKFRP